MSPFRPAWALAALPAIMAAPLAAQEGEWVVQTPLEGFAMLHDGSTDDLSLAEYAPRGETRATWTRMVTVQRFGRVGARSDPHGFLVRLAAQLPVTCRGGRAEPVRELTVSQRRAAQVEAYCPHSPRHHRAETFFMLAIGGHDALHVIQIAFRGRPSAADRDFARRQLASVELCHIGYWPDLCRVPTVP